MTTILKYKLFFLKQNPYFDEGTLFELADELITEASLDRNFDQQFNTVPAELYNNYGYYLPDKGDGIAGFIPQDSVLECPAFAENVAPGECPVKITSMRLLNRADSLYDQNLNNIGIFDVHVEQTIHFQKIVVPLPAKFPNIQSIIVKNRLKNLEIEEYENPFLETINDCKAYCLHIGHIAPGFYEEEINLPKGKFIKLKFIKFFPEYFKEKYPFIVANPVAEKSGTFYINEIGFRPEDYLNKPLQQPKTNDATGFSAELLNLALELKTEWGENFQQPINERMLDKFPALTTDEIKELDKIAGEAESFIYTLAEQELDGKILESDIVSQARFKFPWINDNNLFRLKNIGMFYARK